MLVWNVDFLKIQLPIFGRRVTRCKIFTARRCPTLNSCVTIDTQETRTATKSRWFVRALRKTFFQGPTSRYLTKYLPFFKFKLPFSTFVSIILLLRDVNGLFTAPSNCPRKPVCPGFVTIAPRKWFSLHTGNGGFGLWKSWKVLEFCLAFSMTGKSLKVEGGSGKHRDFVNSSTVECLLSRPQLLGLFSLVPLLHEFWLLYAWTCTVYITAVYAL